MRKFQIELDKVFEYSEDHNAYLFLTNTLTLKRYSGFKNISSKNVLQAVEMWEMDLLRQKDEEAWRNGARFGLYGAHLYEE